MKKISFDGGEGRAGRRDATALAAATRAYPRRQSDARKRALSDPIRRTVLLVTVGLQIQLGISILAIQAEYEMGLPVSTG
jgi:hypothetical protein